MALTKATDVVVGNSQTVDASAKSLVLPQSATPAQTAEGSVVWDTTSDLLTVGDGISRKVITDTSSAQILVNKTLTSPTVDTSMLVNGQVGIGTPVDTSRAIDIGSTNLTSTAQVGIRSAPVANSTALVLRAIQARPQTSAGVFTLNTSTGIQVDNAQKGAGSTITNQYGISISDQNQGDTNFGIYSNVSAGTNKWNLYVGGTASNYFAGSVGIGRLPAGGNTLEVNGNFYCGTSTVGTYIATESAGTTLSGFMYSPAPLVIDTDKVVPVNGISWKTFSDNPEGVSTYIGAQRSTRFYVNGVERLRLDSTGNQLLGLTAAGASASQVIAIGNGGAPTTNVAGGQLYVEAGALKYRGSSGTVTTIAAA